MIEYRFKTNQYDLLNELNGYMPKGKIFKVDEFSGEAWIKVTNFEHTPELTKIVEYFCKFSRPSRNFKILDCSQINNKSTYDNNESLFQ